MSDQTPKSMIGFVDIFNMSRVFFFETNSTLTEEEQKELKKIEDKFIEKIYQGLDQEFIKYKEEVANYLGSRHMVIREVPLEEIIDQINLYM